MRRKGLLAGSMAAAVLLAGCGGGGGGGSSSGSSSSSSSGSSYTPAVTSLADGLWSGDYTSGGSTSQLVGAISPSGQSIFVNTSAKTQGTSPGRLYTFPNMTLSGGTQIDGTLRHYTQQGLTSSNDVSNVIDETYTGSLTQHSSLNGTFTAGGDFTFALDSIYNTAISLATLSGSYKGKADDGATAGVDISSDGSFKAGITYSGSTQSCIITGTLTPTDGKHDLFTATASVSGCSSGNLQGLAFVGDTSAHSLFLGLIRADSGANGTVIVGFK